MTLSFDDFMHHQIKLLLFVIRLHDLPALRSYSKPEHTLTHINLTGLGLTGVGQVGRGGLLQALGSYFKPRRNAD